MKTRFNVELLEHSTSLCNELVVLAAKANGGQKISLNEIYIVASGQKIQYPVSNDDIQITLVSDSLLHVDRKIKDDWVTVCRIEMVEIARLASEDDLKDVLQPLGVKTHDTEGMEGAGC